MKPTDSSSSSPSAAPEQAWSETEDSPDVKIMRAHGMLLEAIRDKGTFTITYGFSRKPNVSDFDAMEKAVNGWLCGTLRSLGCKIPRRRIFRLDLQSAVLADDGKHDVTLTLDFAKLLRGKNAAD
jgi:hypothetical protein